MAATVVSLDMARVERRLPPSRVIPQPKPDEKAWLEKAFELAKAAQSAEDLTAYRVAANSLRHIYLHECRLPPILALAIEVARLAGEEEARSLTLSLERRLGEPS